MTIEAIGTSRHGAGFRHIGAAGGYAIAAKCVPPVPKIRADAVSARSRHGAGIVAHRRPPSTDGNRRQISSNPSSPEPDRRVSQLEGSRQYGDLTGARLPAFLLHNPCSDLGSGVEAQFGQQMLDMSLRCAR